MQTNKLLLKSIKVMYQDSSVNLFLDIESQDKTYELYGSGKSVLDASVQALRNTFEIDLHVSNVVVSTLGSSIQTSIEINDKYTSTCKEDDITLSSIKALLMSVDTLLEI